MPRGRRPKWINEKHQDNGMNVFTLDSWKYFHEFIQEFLIDNKNYVFRGQRSEKWKLEPTINRLLEKQNDLEYNKKLLTHLDNFKYSIRGRAQFIKDIINDDKELWAVGQHNSLATPLLDFSYSPYVAAYFAFFEKEKETDFRVIYALSQAHVKNQINDKVELYKPLSGHNPRLLNQSGLFVYFKTKDSLEYTIKNYLIKNESEKTKTKLYKIRIANKERDVCLKSLNKMNINHNSLFPDLFGASIYCNTSIELKNY